MVYKKFDRLIKILAISGVIFIAMGILLLFVE